MSDQRKDGIAWTDETWNPLRGCWKVSAGCKNRYAETMAARFSGPGQPYEGTIERGRWNGRIRLVPEKLSEPLRWKRPRRIFVNSMSDLFYEGVPFEYVAAVFGVMAACPQHTFQVLTKRPERAVQFFEWAAANHSKYSIPEQCGLAAFSTIEAAGGCGTPRFGPGLLAKCDAWPLPNVWLGVSVEDQTTADERIPHLLACPAAVHWVSYEPALGPVDFIGWGDDAPPGPSADTPVWWSDFVWPEWVPVSIRDGIEQFWREEWGRGPRSWLRDNVIQQTPATGALRSWRVDKNGWATVDKHAHGSVLGRYVHCWNNIGRIVTTDGRVLMASGGSGSGWMWKRRDGRHLDWIVLGGESGPNARPFDVAWARSTIAQCRAAGVACFVKQLGSRPFIGLADMPGRATVDGLAERAWPIALDEIEHPLSPPSRAWRPKLKPHNGGNCDEWPEDLRVREWPQR